MKDKIISVVIWIVVWAVAVYWYLYFVDSNKENTVPVGRWWFTRWNFDPKSMSDEQLQRMADRAGISLEELKEKIESWEDISSIMPMRWVNRWWGRWGSWSVDRGDFIKEWDMTQ